MVTEFSNTACTAVNNYFSVLSQLGYLSDKKVNLLLLLLFLNDLLEEFEGYVTEEDYNKINSIIVCLEDSACMIPYSRYILAQSQVNKSYLNKYLRITNDSNLRSTEEDDARTI